MKYDEAEKVRNEKAGQEYLCRCSCPAQFHDARFMARQLYDSPFKGLSLFLEFILNLFLKITDSTKKLFHSITYFHIKTIINIKTAINNLYYVFYFKMMVLKSLVSD